eukprot:c9321_g1_i1.p1 GENE.c9321_g1_i1~~c9321_g1_i1.p1  ORF type:complete len:148 (+),score=31.93 c9321_g1_i1:838-1281(+)
MTEVDPKMLSLEQLNMVKEQLQEEVQVLQRSLDQLQMASNRFDASKDAIARISKEEAGSELLVPLTSSLYVPGKIVDPSHVLVDIGTGYFAEMSTDVAQASMQRKYDMLKDNLVRLSAAQRMKRKQLQLIMLQMSSKVQSQQAASAQ